MSLETFLIILFNLFILAMTIIENGLSGYRSLIRNIVFVIFFDVIIEKGMINLLKSFSLGLNTLILINVFNILVRKTLIFGSIEWVYYGSETYFLGLDNGFIIFVIPALIIGIYCVTLKGSILFHLVPPLLGIAMIVYLKVTTSVFMLGITLISFLFYKVWKTNILSIVFINIFTFVIFVVLKTQSIIFKVFSNNTSKISTFLSRTRIWEKASYYIEKNLLIGYGFNMERNHKWIGFGGCHNQILDMLLQGGIIVLILYFILLIFAIKGLTRIKNKESYFIFCVFWGFGISMNFESYSSYTGYSLYMLILLFAAKYEKLDKLRRKITTI